MNNPVILTVYGHSYCSLCEVMLSGLQSLRLELGFSLQWIDIEGDDALEQRFGELVPVLMMGDEKLCHYHLDEPLLRERFNRE